MLGVVVAPVLFAAPPAGAEPEGAHGGKQGCVAAFDKAREREQAGHLREARDLLAGCAKAVCGNSLLQQCTSRFTRLDSEDIPSVVPVVTDDSGARRFDVQVKMDGEVLAPRLDAQPLQVDPGVHEFTFSVDSGGSAMEKVLIVEGQRSRVLAIAIHAGGKAPEGAAPAGAGEPAPPQATPNAEPGEAGQSKGAAAGPANAPGEHAAAPPPEEEEHRGPTRPVLPYVLGALGGAIAAGAGAGFILWSSWGNKDGLSLASDLTVGVSVGAGVTSLAIAGWLFATSHGSEKAPSPTAYHLDVAPTRSGAVASLTKAF